MRSSVISHICAKEKLLYIYVQDSTIESGYQAYIVI